MKPLPIKKIIIKAFSLPIKDFNNFINIIIVPYVIILPFYLYTIYYDDFVLNLFDTEGNLIKLMLMGVIDTIFMFFLYIYLASCASLIYKHLITK